MQLKFIGMMLTVVWLLGCTSKQEKIQMAIDEEVVQAERQITKLKKDLEEKKLSNVRWLDRYAEVVKQNRPDLASLVSAIEQDAAPKGPMVQDLEQRLYNVKHKPDDFKDWAERLSEAKLVREAANPAVFNDALTDSVNVLADLDPNLKRIGAVAKTDDLTKNKAKDYGAGSQYIGNPQYGQWVTGSNGLSFWEWYGMYSLFSNLSDGFSGRRNRIYYSDWSTGRGYSYYHDRGRYRYTSPKNYRKQETLAKKTEKNFRSQGKKFNSPYAKKKTGAKSLSRASNTPARSSYSRSSYSRSGASSSSRSSSRSSYSGSTRSGRSRTSRGFSRGK